MVRDDSKYHYSEEAGVKVKEQEWPRKEISDSLREKSSSITNLERERERYGQR